MVWQPEIDEINHRRKLAEQMGGPEGIERQHAQGKLTVRERIAALADPGSFQEVGALVGFATYDDHELVDFRPSNSVMGVCTLDGRKAFVSGGDFTIRAVRQMEAPESQRTTPRSRPWNGACPTSI